MAETQIGRKLPREPGAESQARLGSARLGSARLGSARLGSARLGSARLGSARLGSARLGSARLGSARLLIILFAASSHSSAFKNIALALHDCRRGCRRAGPEPCKRCRVASTEAAEPLGRDEGAKNARAGFSRSGSGHSRPNGRWFESHGAKPIGWGHCRSRSTRATGSTGARAARASRARPAAPARSTRPGHDFAYPMYPSRHFHPVREYQYMVSLIQYFGLKCRNPADGRSGCVYRTDRNGSIASGGPRSDPTGQGRTPPDAGQRPGRGRPGRLPAGKPSPRCMRRRRTGSRARCGRCSPTTGVPRRLREFAGVADGRTRRRDGAPSGCARHDGV